MSRQALTDRIIYLARQLSLEVGPGWSGNADDLIEAFDEYDKKPCHDDIGSKKHTYGRCPTCGDKGWYVGDGLGAQT